MKPTIALLVALAPLAGCSSSTPAASDAGPGPSVTAGDAGEQEDPNEALLVASCAITAPTSCTDMALRYADIAAIVQKSCYPCHSGDPSQEQWPLTQYEDIVDWAQPMRDDLLACDMPPLDGGVAITAGDRLAILTWLRCGEPK